MLKNIIDFITPGTLLYTVKEFVIYRDSSTDYTIHYYREWVMYLFISYCWSIQLVIELKCMLHNTLAIFFPVMYIEKLCMSCSFQMNVSFWKWFQTSLICFFCHCHRIMWQRGSLINLKLHAAMKNTNQISLSTIPKISFYLHEQYCKVDLLFCVLYIL